MNLVDLVAVNEPEVAFVEPKRVEIGEWVFTFLPVDIHRTHLYVQSKPDNKVAVFVALDNDAVYRLGIACLSSIEARVG